MIRLPDNYYTKTMLDGTPKMDGVYQPNPVFYQGEDVVMTIYVEVDGKPLTSENWNISAIVKKNNYAANVLWTGILGQGLIEDFEQTEGYFQVWMPSSASALFLPGTYYLSILAQEKTGAGAGWKDRTLIAAQAQFNIELASASPHPTLHATTNTEYVYDIETGVLTVVQTTVEPTVPLPLPAGPSPLGS